MSSKYIKSIPVSVDAIPKSGAEMATYLNDVVMEAHTLINTLVSPPKDPWSFNFKKSNKYAEVEVTSRNNHLDEGREYWFARRSIHEVGGENLMWDDFLNLLFHGHSENEREYGPSVSRVDKLSLEWDLSAVSVPGWELVQVAAYAIHHHLPWPLNARVFPILLILAKAVDRKEFMVISLPIGISTETTGTNTETQQSVKIIGPKTTVGQYVAVERVIYEEPQTEAGKPNVVWSMATASDASGNLPMALQRRVIGSSIFADVEAFLDYVKKNKA
ncbi:hypothetical protein H072_1216 [Dactylellina haptotyla CBS 200.50]|uniref:DUF3074 domain-containing protein n=1 Tax=Dactylellina haptotyla (strain CBS 200.50) TaxID=1284197 RepID=S8APA1_DACHA|nr:hypothetical protein H072_1216 [Dactylellina haptotyla CBS 200.50]